MHQESPSEGRRAGAVLDRAGQNIGFFVMSTGQRLQHSVPFLRKGPDHKKSSTSPGTPSRVVSPPLSEGQTEHPGQSVMGRAENVVDNVGGALGLVGSVVGLRVRRATARMREEVEDMWAEAQSLRAQRERQREETSSGQQHEEVGNGQKREEDKSRQQQDQTVT